jgi:hypothetical protein
LETRRYRLIIDNATPNDLVIELPDGDSQRLSKNSHISIVSTSPAMKVALVDRESNRLLEAYAVNLASYSGEGSRYYVYNVDARNSYTVSPVGYRTN